MEELTERQVLESARSAPLFSALPEPALKVFLGRCIARRFPAGQTLFSPAQKAESFFVVLRGQVKVFKLSPRGDEQILHLLGPGETLAEAAMWAGVHYPAFAQAVKDTALLSISRKTLFDAVARNSELAVGMLIGLSNKLREFSVLIEQLSLKEVPARLAAALLEESRRAGAPSFRLRQTKRQLAAQIGTVAETLSRCLRKLQDQKLIKVRGSAVTLLDETALSRLAHGE